MTNWKRVTINGQQVKQITLDGKLLFKAGRLPSEYQEVEYIQSSGNQKITTDVGYEGITATLDIQYLTSTGRQLSGVNLDSAGYFGVNTSYNYEMYEAMSGTDGRNRGTIVFSHTLTSAATLTFEGRTISDGATIGHGGNFTLFSLYPSYPVKAKLYSCQIRNNANTLIRDFVPCYRISDNVIGLYDLVNKVFYTNSGSGSFTKGGDV